MPTFTFTYVHAIHLPVLPSIFIYLLTALPYLVDGGSALSLTYQPIDSARKTSFVDSTIDLFGTG